MCNTLNSLYGTAKNKMSPPPPQHLSTRPKNVIDSQMFLGMLHEIACVINMVPHLSPLEQQVMNVLVCSAGFFLDVPLW